MSAVYCNVSFKHISICTYIWKKVQKPVNHIQNSENNVEMYENIMKSIYHGIYMLFLLIMCDMDENKALRLKYFN